MAVSNTKKLGIIVPLFLLILQSSGGNIDTVNLDTISLDTADLVINVDQDTFIYSSSDDTINGLETHIVSSGTNSIAFFRFPLDQVNTTISAYLEFYNYADDIVEIGAYGIDDDAWDELSLSGSNHPQLSTELLDKVTLYADNWYKWDVTDFVKIQDDGWVSLALKAETGTGRMQGYSKEGSVEKSPILSINGSIHTADIPTSPIYETTTVSETESITITVANITITDTITQQAGETSSLVLLTSTVIFVALVKRRYHK